MITASSWVPRGFSKEHPEKYEITDEDMAKIDEVANITLDDSQKYDNEETEDNEEPIYEKATRELKDPIEIDDDLKEYDLENYDNDEAQEGETPSIFPGLSNTGAKVQNEENDAYLRLPSKVEEEEEKEELHIYPTDNLVLATRTEDDISYLDVLVYDDGAGTPQGAQEEEGDSDAYMEKGFVREPNLYAHHDVMLPAFPLCIEWINYKVGIGEERTLDNLGNFVAVGTFDPTIEIWNLDYVEKSFPDMILGDMSYLLKGAKKSKKKSHVTSHHTDAVLSLAHNKYHRNVLASTSADTTVKLWDLSTGTAVRSMNTTHSKKTVSTTQWHANEETILLTGGYDGTCGVSDVRIADSEQMTKSYHVTKGEEVENVSWGHPSKPELFFAGTDGGNVYCFDVRNQDNPLWTLHAHDAGISSLSTNSFIPSMLATTAMGEKTVKLWKAPVDSPGGPSMVLSRDFGVGNVLTSSFACDIEVAGHISVGGVNGALKMWDLFSNKSVRKSFGSELKQVQLYARSAAKLQGRASRIARKYQNDTADSIFTAQAGALDNESDSEDQDATEEKNGEVDM